MSASPDVPSVDLVGPATPLLPMSRLEVDLGLASGRLWVKRDDLTALAAGGNKARKLELLCGDALARGATVLVTGGAVQSNHVRMTAAAAAMCGLGAVGVVGGRRTEIAEGNVVIDAVMGIDLVFASERYGALGLEDAIDAECARLESEGERPYRIPLGGSSSLGASGYVSAAAEIEAVVPGATVYVADGTGGTHAGLVAGFGGFDRVCGVDVGAVPSVAEVVSTLAQEVAVLAGRPRPAGEVRIDRSHVGEGYGRSTPACIEAIRVAGRREGLVLDPVYTGKAFAALLADAESGRLPDGPVVFLHTGGLPGLLTVRHAAEFTLKGN